MCGASDEKLGGETLKKEEGMIRIVAVLLPRSCLLIENDLLGEGETV